MATFVLIHGAADVGWSWHLAGAELRALGHEVLAPDLPCEDDTAGVSEYADTVMTAIGDRDDLVVVGQSFGGFTAALVAARLPERVRLLVFVSAMIPRPGEAPAQWWANTGYNDQVEHGEGDLFTQDVEPALAEEAVRKARGQSEARMGEPWPAGRFPEVPTRFVLCTEDRFFPPAFMRRVVAERLGGVPDEIASGHCPQLSRPKELAALFAGYLTQY